MRLAGRALSRAVASATRSPAWLEGLLRGGALLLMHAHDLWAVLDGWLAALAADAFDAVLPLLRRAFSSFAAPERRSMGEIVRTLARRRRAGGAPAAAPRANSTRRGPRCVLPVLAQCPGGAA